MGLDLRWPIGLMFSIIGALLAIAGLMSGSNEETLKRTLNINIDLIWGLVLLVFGAFMLLLAWRGNKAAGSQPPGPENPGAPKS